jgi:hypothetical protein
MSRNIEMRRARERASRRQRLAQGICEKCPCPARRGLTTCAPCGKADSDRRVDYQRRHGARVRYADGSGYRPRGTETGPRVADEVAACLKCAGFVVDLTIEWRCVNCGWRGWPNLAGRRAAWG